MTLKLAYRPDPHDPRDKPFALLRELLASSRSAASGDLVVIPQTTPISDQGSLGSCVANATADALELLSREPTQLSRLHLYFLARLHDGSECQDEGTFVRSAFHVLRTVGICAESTWPYVEANVHVRPPIVALQDAYDHRIAGAYRITTRGHARGDDIETALRAQHPVVFGTEVGSDFLSYDGGESKIWQYPDRSVGGHAMVIVGVRRHEDDTRDFLVRNSWGDAWGLRSRPGHCWFAERYIWEVADLWVPTQEWA